MTASRAAKRTWHMAMYFYASKISAIACGTRCKQTVLQKSRGQRDRDKCQRHHHPHTHQHHRRHHRRRCHISSNSSSSDSESADDCCLEAGAGLESGLESGVPAPGGIFSLDSGHLTAETALLGGNIRYRRRHSAEQLSAYDLEMGFQQLEVSAQEWYFKCTYILLIEIYDGGTETSRGLVVIY